jgi:endoglucanase
LFERVKSAVVPATENIPRSALKPNYTFFTKVDAKSFVKLGSAALLTAALFLFAPFAEAQNAFIRVNQVGYEIGTVSRAYLMCKVSEAGAVFSVLDAKGVTAFTAPVGATVGTWGAFNVYPIDFKVNGAGTYTIAVNGPVSGTSLAFPIDKPTKLYTQPLANTLYFYQNERDGANFIKTPLRKAAGHLNDSNATVFASPMFDDDDNIINDLQPTGTTIDASGGWWDAGDYLKFVQTHSYTVALMLIGIRDFPKQMGAGSVNSDFTEEAKFGLDWLTKMWDPKTETLYYQVGIGTDFDSNPNLLSDHDLWRLPQVDDTEGGTDPTLIYIRNRPVFVAGPAGGKISPNLAGRLAASFAGCYQIYHQSNPNYADNCLIAAEKIFDLANTAPTGNLLTTAPFDFYGESEWRDDMELGATELYFALAGADCPLPSKLAHTNPNFYLKAGAHWANAYITGPGDAGDTLNLYDVSGLAHFELFRAIGNAGHPANLEVTQAELVADLRKELQNAVAQGGTDPFGFGYPWGVYDTTTHGAGLSVMAREYALLTQSTKFDTYSREWSANILGANAWGSSFIVGDGEVFPNCMQHQVANILGSLDGTAPLLRGALVEGPNSAASNGFLDGMRVCPPAGGNIFKKFNGNGAVYKDDQQSYSTVEPAIDLTAASFLMFAWRMAGAPAGLVPTQDISTALEPAVTPKAAAVWPTQRKSTRHKSQKATITSDSE